ncbi:MAG TPA: ATP-binding SpoIIE family protein phosphatase [Xanthobacteraceae bacterium]|jgi:anti-sigma regulatory factor (Ser/Thr protein kinase)|nr:ATP-binding SpoIIE family protein phosphatase [Xanthobacteraceae bacterium]
MTISVAVNDASQVAEARRQAVATAAQNGFNEADTGRVALVATELGTNLIKHGRGGELLVGTYQDKEGNGIELMALDRGPGIGNVEECLRDGYSSAGTAGNGLGAVIRQSHLFDIASWPGAGTGVMARLQPGTPHPQRRVSHSGWGAVAIAMPGEEVCGDSWSVEANGVVTLLVADGLGHGREAAEASVEAVRLFHRFIGHRVPTLLDYVHGGLRSTRGAAVSIARFDPAARQVTFAGIGNVAGALASGGNLRRMVSMPGTAGHNARKIQGFDYPFESGLIVLASDGISTQWNLAQYRDIQSVHPALIAAIVYRDFGRRRDDMTVLVGKWVPTPRDHFTAGSA